jgi:hypothetical protein
LSSPPAPGNLHKSRDQRNQETERNPDEIIDSTSKHQENHHESERTKKPGNRRKTAETIIDSKVRDERDRKTGRKPVGNDGQQGKYYSKQRS